MTKLIVTHPRLVLLAILVVTAGFAPFAARVEIDPSVERMLVVDDPALLYYRDFLERFGSDDIVVVRLRMPRLFASESLDLIREISDRIAAITLDGDGDLRSADRLIDRVASLTETVQLRATTGNDGEPELDVGPLVREPPHSAAERAELWSRATEDSLVVGHLVSAPASDDPDAELTALVVANIIDRPGDLGYRSVIQQRVEEIVGDTLASHPEVAASAGVTGSAMVKSAVGHLTEIEMIKSDALSWVANLAILMLAFRWWPAVLFPLLAVGCGSVWTVGLLSILGSYLNPLSVVILPLIKTVGISTAVHFTSCYLDEAASTRSARSATERALRRVLLPCFLASFTTAAGFLSLATSDVAAVRDVGCFAAWGVMATWLITMTLVPALLLGRELPEPELASRITGAAAWTRSLEALADWVLRRRRPIAASGCAVLVLAGAGISTLRAETDVYEYLPANHTVRTTQQALQREVGGVNPLDIVIRAAPGAALDPGVLAKVEKLQRWLREQPEVVLTHSIVDILTRLHEELNGGEPEQRRLPETAQQAADLLFVFDAANGDERTAPYLAPDWEQPEEIRVHVRLTTANTRSISELIARVEAYLVGGLGALPEADPPAARVRLSEGEIAGRVTGVLQLYATMAGTVVAGQLRSLSLAFAVIWLTVWLLLRSARAGALAMVPNLLPMLAVLGLMGLAGITLNIATAMITAICVGIAVDDTIHFLVRYRRQLDRAGDPERAIQATLREGGRAIVLTSLVVLGGFLVFIGSAFVPLVHFGLLASMAIALALLADLILLPALLSLLPSDAPGPRHAQKDRSK